jgi:RimJ/RimL family protein N-acetyltransferase
VTVRLVPLTHQHAAALDRALEDADIVANTRVPEPVPAGFATTWIDRYEHGRVDGSREGFALEDDEGSFLGLGLIPRIDRETETAELGYVVVPEARGRGVATEALRLLTELAFAELAMARLELMIVVHNEASKIVARRCGYVREGVLRSAHFKQGRREDTEIWSRLATDP